MELPLRRDLNSRAATAATLRLDAVETARLLPPALLVLGVTVLLVGTDAALMDALKLLVLSSLDVLMLLKINKVSLLFLLLFVFHA